MKAMKKLAILMLALCLIVPCFSMVTYAADGKIMFTDPETAVGETVEVKGVVERSSGNMGKIEITMTYDTGMLKFNSGDGVTESEAGQLTYSVDVTNETGRRKEFIMKFDVLKEGTAKLEIQSATVKDVSGNTKNYTKGSSTIKIAKGEGTATVPEPTVEPAIVKVNGVSYTISNSIPENEIPKGYVAATLEYDQVKYNVVKNETSGLYLAYLLDEDNVGKFFMYVDEDATFAPYEEIAVSNSVTIILLSDVSEIKLPEEYVETTVILNGQKFPAWQNANTPDYCILFAMNHSGEKSLYQFDNAEGTYQRFTAPEIVVEEIDDSFIGKLSSFLENHLDYVIYGTGFGFLLFILIIVVLSVKLYNRNAELDELYDEYGIDVEEEEKTADDVVLNLDEEDDEADYDDENAEVEFFVQQGLKEVFPEEEATSLEEAVQEKVAEKPAEEVTKEVSIGKVLEQTVSEEKEEFYDDDELLENFSMDFMDLDD